MPYALRNTGSYNTTNLNSPFLLLEDGGFLLQEDGLKIKLEQLISDFTLSARDTQSFTTTPRN